VVVGKFPAPALTYLFINASAFGAVYTGVLPNLTLTYAAFCFVCITNRTVTLQQN
jgi:hypothetical protein